MLLLLQLNAINIVYTQKELVDFGIRIAEGTLDEKDIRKWIKDHQT
jgi:death-on-curing protein